MKSVVLFLGCLLYAGGLLAQSLPNLSVNLNTDVLVFIANEGRLFSTSTNLVTWSSSVQFFTAPNDEFTQGLPADDQNQPLLQLASRMIPGRFVVQFNFLMTSNIANPAVSAAAISYGALTAFQVNNWYGSFGSASSACGGTVNQPASCDDASYLDMLRRGIYPLGQTNSLRSQYIEVWATNAIAFTNAIWQAHLELFGGQ